MGELVWPAWPSKPANSWWPGSHLNKFLVVSKMVTALQAATHKKSEVFPPSERLRSHHVNGVVVASCANKFTVALRSAVHRTSEFDCDESSPDFPAERCARTVTTLPLDCRPRRISVPKTKMVSNLDLALTALVSDEVLPMHSLQRNSLSRSAWYERQVTHRQL